MHKIVYLPVARQDLTEIVLYIAGQLKAPGAASELLDEIDAAVRGLAQFPYSCRVYQSAQPLDDEYRLLSVRNYALFYVVTEKTVEIRRVIYAKRDLTKIIK